MTDNRKDTNVDFNNLIDDKTFWDLYPIDLLNIEGVSVQSLPVPVRVINLLMHNGVKTLADLYRMKIIDFRKLKGSGDKCFKDTCKYLSDLSNNSVKLTPDVYPSKNDVTIPSIISKNINNILKQDFSFVESSECSDLEKDFIEKYRQALDVIGVDFARACYETPKTVLAMISAFNPFIKTFEEREYRKSKIQNLYGTIPTNRLNNIVNGYIDAFTSDEEKRNSLYQIYGLNERITAKISQPIIEAIDDSVKKFAVLVEFLKWCDFDISKQIDELFDML